MSSPNDTEPASRRGADAGETAGADETKPGKPALIGRLLKHRRAGDGKLAWNRFGLAAPEMITLASAAFANGGRMPARTAGIGVGENVSPPLEWTGVPRDAAELLLVIEDPDAPLRRPVIHLALAGIPPSLTGFDEGDLTTGGRFGRGTGSRGHQGYAGPRPIPGHGPHRYVFQLYALATPLNVPGNAGARAIVAAADGKVLSRGRLTGLYER